MDNLYPELQYLSLLKKCIQQGVFKEPARDNMPRTKALFVETMRFDMQQGFPLLTTKQLFHRGMVHELLWFLKGDTNIQYLHENNVKKFWHQDTYGYWLKHFKANPNNAGCVPMTFEEWCNALDDPQFVKQAGDAGLIYGYQWRHFGGTFDQIVDIIKRIVDVPFDRYKVVTAWNPIDRSKQSLSACHMLFQLNCRPLTDEQRVEYAITAPEFVNIIDEIGFAAFEQELDRHNVPKLKLDLALTQRSCDMCLGVPINIASYALLLHLLSKITNCVPGEFIWTGNDVHIYEHHIDAAQEQIQRTPFKFPELVIDNSNWSMPTIWNTKTFNTLIDSIKIDDFKFVNYEHYPKIDFELFTGIFKPNK